MSKAKNFAEWKAGISMLYLPMFNTAYADADGTIFYVYNASIPIRDPHYDWTQPVDGSDPRTEWKGLPPLRRFAANAQSDGRLRSELQLDPVSSRPTTRTRPRATSRNIWSKTNTGPAEVSDLPQALTGSPRCDF